MPLFSKESVLRLSLRPRRLFASIAVSLLLTGSILGQAKDVAAPQSTGKKSHLISGVPLAFEENDGQLPSEFSFLGRTQDYSVAIARDRLKFVLPGGSADSAIDVRFAGSRGGSPVPLSGVAYRSNYFIGADPSQWHQGVANFSRVGVRHIYPGIDTEFYEKSGQLEHDFIVAPGNDAGSIRLDLISTQRATLTGNGDIVIPAKEGELRFRKPSAFQFNTEGKRVEVAADYLLTGNALRFRLGAYDKSRTLIIDPVILFATYLSGSAGSTPAQLATDGSGTLFTVGTTTSVNGFPPLPGSGTPTNSSGAGSSVFIAALTTSQLGSALKWITFLGNAGASTASSIAYSAFQSGTLYVGGQTSAAGFPGAGATGSFGGAFPSGFGSTTGFVTSLNAGTGGTPNSTYISSSGHSSTITDTTSVTWLAADTGGDVYISGYGKGSGFTLNASLGGFVPTASGLNNAFVLELDSSLDTSTKLVTYLQGTEAADYKATALQVGGLGRIYVAGTVGGVTSPQFPSAKSFAAATPFYTAANDFSPCTSVDTSTRVFLAQILPGNSTTHSTLGFSLFTCGTNGASDSETATGVALGASGIYLVGETGSPDLVASVNYSLPSFAAGTNSELATFSGGLQPTFAGTQDGYVIKVPVSGAPLVAAEPSAFTYLGGAVQANATSASSALNAVTIDDTNHLLQLGGQTNASRASMPGVGALGLPSGMDPSGDNPRALLYTFDDTAAPFLSTAKSISYLGNTATNSTALSVLPDGNAGAYVLTQDTASASSVSFSSSAAIGVAAAGQPNAYIADIQGTAVPATPVPGLTFTVASGSPDVCQNEPDCEIGYNGPGDLTTIKFSWNLNTAQNADDVVLNFPPQPYLSAPFTIEEDGTALGSCVSQSQLNQNGATCPLPSPLTPGPHTIALTANASAAAGSAPAGTTFQVIGNAADAQSEYQPAPQPTVTVAKTVSIALTFTQNQTQVDAAKNGSDTGVPDHLTEVTYKAMLQNTSANDSPFTTLHIALPTAFQIIGTTTITGVSPTGCKTDGTGCTSVDIPAGGTLTYSFTGIYLASSLTSGNANGDFTETVTADASALPKTNSTNNQASAQVQTTVRGFAALALSVTADKTTPYNLSTTAISSPVTFTITLNNSGPNASGPITANAITNTLPQYFVVSSASIAPAGAGVCDTTGGTGCTSLSSIASGQSAIYTVIGSFPDKGINTDAVPQNASSAPASDTAQFTQPLTTYDPNAATPQKVTVTVQRKADLTLTGAVAVTNPSAPCDTASGTSACLYMANDGALNGAVGTGINDTAKYTVTLQNAGPNIATTASLGIPLPPNFLVAADPSVAAGAISVVSSTGLTCPQPTIVGQTLTCTGYVPVGPNTVMLTSKFAKTTVPANVKAITTNPATNSITVSASVVGANNPGQLPNVTVERAVHLVTMKYVCRSPGITNPAQPCPAVPGTVNLDERVANDAPGKNDLAQVQIQIGNTQLNQAYGVTVTDPLPSYFILTQMPDPTVATCSVTGMVQRDAYGNPMTGLVTKANPVNLSCTLTNPIPVGTATPGSSTPPVHGTVTANTAYAQLTYYGKFEDNGLNTDIVPPNANTMLVDFLTAQSASTLAVVTDTVNDATSLDPSPLTVQRAAHMRIVQPPQFVQVNDAALPPAGVPSGPGIAEAQPGANGGGTVINPMRYKVIITNDGPNIATHPLLSVALPLNFNGAPTSFAVQGQSLEPALTGFPGSPTCTAGNVCLDGGAINPGAQVAFNLDGFFNLNTLTEGNSGVRSFNNSSVTAPTTVDSNAAGTGNGDGQANPAPITVVNTPVGSSFALAPFDENLAQPLGLKLTTVQVAGITSLVPSAMPPLPSGPSPNPPDNGATKGLYQFATGGTYYTLGTTAGVPSANANPTSICLGSIPGTFQKPERVLLWALSNAPAGTVFNPVPHFTSNGTTGDITTVVLAQGGAGYLVPVANTTYPPPPAQPQPAEICGVMNGLSSAAAPTTLAVLEPVNFAPFVRTEVTAANSGNSQPGKGVTAAAAVVDLTISPQNNYDYNDQDPCYTGSTGTQRSTCNDNVQVTTFLFGGGNFIGDTQQVHTYFNSTLAANSKPQFNLPAGQPQLYVVLTDQLGAQGYKNFGTDPAAPIVCDPGNPSTSYTPSTPTCPLPTPLPTGVTVPPAQTFFPNLPNNNTSVEVALLSTNVGFGGSSGLIPLPETPTPEAISRITAGQTAGFVWNWLTERPEVQGNGGAPPVLTLTCDATSPVPAGVQCNIPQTYTYSTGTGNSLLITAPPAIYVVTQSNTAVGALQEGPLSHDLRVVAAIVFPIGAIPLVLLVRRRKALKLSGWLAVALFASLVGLSIGCGSSSFNNMGGTTATATPAGTYQFVVTATGTDANGNAISIKSYPFAVTVTAVQ